MKTTHANYKALTKPLLLDDVGPDGLKRSIQAFPKVLGKKVLAVSGLDAFRLHLPYFLGQRRGEDLADPELGSSLHALLDVEDESHASELVRRVAQDEISRRFGKYLDALHTFDVTVHRETRTMWDNAPGVVRPRGGLEGHGLLICPLSGRCCEQVSNGGG